MQITNHLPYPKKGYLRFDSDFQEKHSPHLEFVWYNWCHTQYFEAYQACVPQNINHINCNQKTKKSQKKLTFFLFYPRFTFIIFLGENT